MASPWSCKLNPAYLRFGVVVATTAVGREPRGVAINPSGTRVYVPNAGSNNVSVIDTSNNSVVATVPVGDQPYSFGQFIGLAPTTTNCNAVTEIPVS